MLGPFWGGALLFTSTVATHACEVKGKAAYVRAKQFKQSGAYLLAVDCYTSALATARQNKDRAHVLSILRQRGESYQYAGDYALAWLDLGFGRLQEPRKARFYEGLGWLYVFTGAYTEAANQLEYAMTLSPQNKWVHLNLGWAYYLNGERQKGYALWKPLLEETKYKSALLKDIALLKKHGVNKGVFEPLGAQLR